jgi:hypothetical protein
MRPAFAVLMRRADGAAVDAAMRPRPLRAHPPLERSRRVQASFSIEEPPTNCPGPRIIANNCTVATLVAICGPVLLPV